MSKDAREMESRGRFEVPFYTYRYTHGIDEIIFECDRCAALVAHTSIAKHNNFHSLLQSYALPYALP